VQTAGHSLPPSRHTGKLEEAVLQILEFGLLRLGKSLKGAVRARETILHRQQARPDPGEQAAQSRTSRLSQPQFIELERQPLVDESREIEAEIKKISGMFSEMADTVSLHGLWMERIEHNTAEASEWAERGREQLVEAWQKIRGNRSLILKLFLLLFILATLLVLFQ
jgi:hypothetical protein